MDCSELDTPFGPRTGGAIPPLLEKLSDANARVRSRALRDLHQQVVAIRGGYGTPFLPAALAVVPRLGAHLANPGLLEPQLAQLLTILGDVAAGNHRLHLERGLGVVDLDRDGIGPARATHAELEPFVDAIAAQLASKDASTRSAAAFALAWLPGVASRSRPSLLARLDAEKNAVVRSSIFLSLGYLGAAAEVSREHHDEASPAGVCAALATLLCAPNRLLEDLDAALAPSKPVVKGLVFADGALLQVRSNVLRGATIRLGDLDAHLALAARMPAAMRAEVDGWTVLVAARAPATTPLDPLDPADLPERERGVLRDLAATLRSANNPHLGRAFWRAGLFAFLDSNERALGVDPPGPLDRRVGGHALWWWLHGARSGRIPFERWIELLGDADVIAILEDAATAPYELYRDRFRTGGYDVAPLLDVIERTALAFDAKSALLDERIAQLRSHAASPSVAHGKGPLAWP